MPAVHPAGFLREVAPLLKIGNDTQIRRRSDALACFHESLDRHGEARAVAGQQQIIRQPSQGRTCIMYHQGAITPSSLSRSARHRLGN